MSTTTEAVNGYISRVIRAAQVLDPRFVGNYRTTHIENLLRTIGSAFPEDALDPAQALHYMVGRSWHIPLPSDDDIDMVRSNLPDTCCNVRVIIQSDWSIKIEGQRSKHGPYFYLTYRNTSLPFVLDLYVYQDMDDEANHGDECDGDDCNCEAQVDVHETLHIAKQDGALEALTSFLNQHLGY